MKKLLLTLAVVFTLSFGAVAQNAGGGLFQRGDTEMTTRELGSPALPAHGQTTNQPAAAPIGSGALLLIGFGAAYAMSKRKK